MLLLRKQNKWYWCGGDSLVSHASGSGDVMAVQEVKSLVIASRHISVEEDEEK